ncbi:MAG: ECF-type sigma factor [Verrucomicrobiales bacterium]|nr:ECF-type sigma factor [Verrucomicrobiales bacterium]
MSDVTRILERVEKGDAKAAEELLPLVYTELRKLAAAKMAQEKPGQTLQATALVHEAWIRLAGSTQQQWRGRDHFFSAAAEAMRRILVENARRKQRIRHGGGLERVDVSDVAVATPLDEEKILLVNEALESLVLEDPLQADVVKLRFFAGLTNAEAAAVIGVSEKTVQRYWSHAKAWLYGYIRRRQ